MVLVDRFVCVFVFVCNVGCEMHALSSAERCWIHCVLERHDIFFPAAINEPSDSVNKRAPRAKQNRKVESRKPLDETSDAHRIVNRSCPLKGFV